MASRWPAVGASLRRRSLQNQERLEESEALQPVASHPDTSSGALGSLCRQFQRRLPLRAVSLNLGVGPSWKRLETPEPGQQGLQAAAHSAKSTLGAMSQRIQESCQSGTKWLVETQVKARRRKRGAQKGSSPPAHSLSQRSTRLSVAAPAHSTLGPWEKEYHRLSVQMSSRAHPWRRSRREAAFRSPYSSAEPLCSPSESDSDLEPVGAGIRHLQKVSQELEEAIVAEDRKQAIADHHALILRIHTSRELLVMPLSCHKQGPDSQSPRWGLLGVLCFPASATSRPTRDHLPQPASDSGRSRRGGGNHSFYFPLGLRNSTHV